MKMLMMTASFGTGHNQVAAALAEAATGMGHSAEVVDGLSESAPIISTVMTKGFIQLLKTAPGLYRMAYDHAEVPGRLDGTKQGLSSLLTRVMRPKLLPFISRTQPDLIVCTHPFILGVVANLRLRGQIQVPVAGVLTDFAPHGFWLHRGVDEYFVATSNMMRTMVGQGVHSGHIHATGIPIRAAFNSPVDRLSAAADLGLDPARPTVLMMGGGLGMGPICEMVEHLCNLPLPLQVLVVTGQNRQLYEQLMPHTIHDPNRKVSVHLYGYVSHVHSLMAASDLLVGKAGAVTAAEALAMGLPALFVRPIPGHEERNQAVLVATGAARSLPQPNTIGEALLQVLANSEELTAMRQAAQRTGQPQAAEHVVERLALLFERRGTCVV